MALRLRLRGPSGKQHTASLAGTATFADLRKEAATAFALAEGEVEVLLGFPPALCTAASDSLLSSLVKSGESATVRQATAGPATQASSSEAFGAVALVSDSTVVAGASASPAMQPPSAQAASKVAAPVANTRSSQPWSCPACTLQNPSEVLQCGACDGPKPGSSSAVSSGIGAQVAKMPDDNSCLFHSIAFLLDPSKRPEALRDVVAQQVRSDPTQWNEAILGKPRAEYLSFITDPRRWGGQVEIAIFASAFRSEIAVVEVQTGRCDVFGEGCGYPRRIYLLHSGIHFDAVTFGPSTQREVSMASVAESDAAALQLAAQQRAAGAYVDQDTMRLRCKICGFIANGDYEARLHAGTVGHKEFAPA